MEAVNFLEDLKWLQKLHHLELARCMTPLNVLESVPSGHVTSIAHDSLPQPREALFCPSQPQKVFIFGYIRIYIRIYSEYSCSGFLGKPGNQWTVELFQLAGQIPV